MSTPLGGTAKKKRKGDSTYVQPTVLSEDSDDSVSPKKKKKRKKGTKSGKRRVSQTKRTRVKTKAQGKIRRVVDDLSIKMNVIVPISMDLTPFEVLVPAFYTPFADPPGCPAATGGYKGCQRVRITLGPKQQFLQTGTDSSAAYPHALADAKAFYPLRTFVSGHVLNANFGGPDAPGNMTILTSSANSSQRLFDNNVENARAALYNVYRDLVSCDPIDGYFTTIGYGIAVDIQVTGAVWTPGYPGNCISSQITLSANVVGEAALLATFATQADITTNFRQNRQTVFNSIHRTIASVQTYVTTAMTGTPIANT